MSLRAAAAICTPSSCVSMVRAIREPLVVAVIVRGPVFRGSGLVDRVNIFRASSTSIAMPTQRGSGCRGALLMVGAGHEGWVNLRQQSDASSSGQVKSLKQSIRKSGRQLDQLSLARLVHSTQLLPYAPSLRPNLDNVSSIRSPCGRTQQPRAEESPFQRQKTRL
jgi:hypothetical protein